nr:hypothetical protein [Tanacetum cinerariifolium]
MNEELRNRSQNKEPLLKQPYVPFRMHTRSRDYQPLDKQPEHKLVQVNAKVDSFLVSQDTTVVDKTADKQVVDVNTIKMIKEKKGKIGVISPAVIGDCGEISLTDVTEQQPYTTKPPLVKRRSNRINREFNQAVIGDVCEKIPLTAWIEHLDLWIPYMWRTRLDGANWAMCGASFCPHILGKQLPSSYNVTDALFPKRWWDVEKVRSRKSVTGG